jgi:uncharacterized LabA/DUF88 family protein
MTGIAWFIDGEYASKAFRSVADPARIDYAKFRVEVEDDAKARIDEAYYFNCNSNPPIAEQDGFHRFLKSPPPSGPGLRVKLYWLQTKHLRWPPHMGGDFVVHPDTGEHFEQTTQKGVDVGLAFHLIRSFSKSSWDRLYLVAGDGDFHEVVQHLVEDEGVKLSLLGTRETISGELAPYGEIIDFADIYESIARAPHEAEVAE